MTQIQKHMTQHDTWHMKHDHEAWIIVLKAQSVEFEIRHPTQKFSTLDKPVIQTLMAIGYWVLGHEHVKTMYQ